MHSVSHQRFHHYVDVSCSQDESILEIMKKKMRRISVMLFVLYILLGEQHEQCAGVQVCAKRALLIFTYSLSKQKV